MNDRLQKKCLIASAGLHLTLVLVFFFGSGFLGSHKPENMQVLEFVPMITTDAPVSGGGNPNAKPPPANPTPPQPQPRSQPQPPQPQPVAQPDPPKAPVRTEKPDPNSLETKSEKKPVKPVVSLKPWKPSTAKPVKPTPSPNTEADSQARADAERRRLAGSLARSLKENLSSGTSVEMPGPGGGGATYANYKQVVMSVYAEAWIIPDDVDAEVATATASVTIARDGRVISARMTRSSGNRGVDRSVQATLDRVRFVAPFPEGSKDSERSFTINFNLKAKKAIG